MRIGYSEDEDFPGQFELWQANCTKSLRGKAGQKALRELEAALLAMPDKRLHREVFVEATGEVCALGELAVQRKMREGLTRDQACAALSTLDPDDMTTHGKALGLPRLVVWKIVEQNDIENDLKYMVAEGPNQYPYGYRAGLSISVDMPPEERYANVLKWVQDQIVR